MKKITHLLVLAVFLAAYTAVAQWPDNTNNKIKGNGNVVTQTRNTGDYDEIKVGGPFNVNLVAGKEGNITLKGEENLLSAIKVEIVDNALKIYVQHGTNIRTSEGKAIEVTVPFEKISEVSLASSGNIQTKDKIKSDNFTAKLAGSGNFKLDVEAVNFVVNVSGSGDVVLKGKAQTFTSKVSGSGNINANDLKCKNVEANVSGSGNSRINCEESLVAKVSGSGNIKYSGNPEKRDVKVSGSGSISKV
ncbi:head GIN domain-containing protein [Flavobacterium foetidum]|uniref:head GIN domain-containing protein n=1 Tax=Flavobacterium foetidum TaxID=2026681 RepID=UPI001074C62F|nr:head GIN domain-containing protein [Flavobacterium foetidum]KAF2513961.1 DUF2807 domain-containing protein [Flavobacterium foetidum]